MMRRPEIWAGGFFVVSVVAAFWLVLYGRSFFVQQAPPQQATSAQAQPVPTQAAPPTPGAMGSTGWMRAAGDQYAYRIVWVNRTGLWAWNRAYAERDDKGETAVMSLYETLRVNNGTQVRVVARDADALQIEILEGSDTGRRGWMDADSGALTSTAPVVPPTPIRLDRAALTEGGIVHLRSGTGTGKWPNRNEQWRAAPDRQAYEDWRKTYGVGPAMDAGTNQTTATATWISVTYGQSARITQVDGDTVEVELVGGQHNAKRCWVSAENLAS